MISVGGEERETYLVEFVMYNIVIMLEYIPQNNLYIYYNNNIIIYKYIAGVYICAKLKGQRNLNDFL